VPTHSTPMGSIAATNGYSSPDSFYNGSMFSAPWNPPEFAPAQTIQTRQPAQYQPPPPPPPQQRARPTVSPYSMTQRGTIRDNSRGGQVVGFQKGGTTYWKRGMRPD